MGIFSSQYSTTTGTSVSRLIDDDSITPVWQELPLKATINKVTIGRAYKNELLLGLTSKVERLYSIAKDPTRYELGLLNHTIVSDAIGAQEVRAQLEALHGGPVSLEYHFLDSPNLMHAGFEYLTYVQGYKQSTNQVTGQSAIKGFPVYLEQMLATIIQVDAANTAIPPLDELPQWELYANQRYVPWTNPYINAPQWSVLPSGQNRVFIHLAYLDSQPQPGTPTADDWAANGIPELAVPPDTTDPEFAQRGYSWEAAYGLTDAVIDDFIVRYALMLVPEDIGYNIKKTYFSTKYSYDFANPKGASIGYFTHDSEAGTLPDIEAVIDQPKQTGNFMPWVFLRHNFISLATEEFEDSTQYKQSTNLLKTIGFDFKDIGASVDANPGIADISQVFITFGIPLSTQRQQGLQYLYEFIHWLNLDDPMYSGFPVHGVTNDWSKSSHRRAIRFYDGNTRLHGQARMTLTYRSTSERLVTGVIAVDAKVGECKGYKTVESQIYKVRHTDHRGDVSYYNRTKSIDVYWYEKQLSPTQYKQVIISDPKVSYKVTDAANNNEEEVFADEELSLLIPLSHDIAHEHFKITDRRTLYSESLHMVSNAYIRTKLKWYETDTFAFVLKATAIVLTVVSLGSMGPTLAATYASILAAVGNTVVAMVLTALLVVGVQYGLAKLFSLVAKEIGGKWGTLGALLLTAVAIYAVSTGVPSADQWVLAANGFTPAANAQSQEEILELGESLVKLEDEFTDFMDIKNELEKELDIRKSLLERVGIISVHNPYESASQFFERTASGVDAPQIMVSAAEFAISSALQLPSTQLTLKEDLI